MVMFRSLPISSPCAKVLVLLLILVLGLGPTAVIAATEAIKQEESNQQDEQQQEQTATIHNPYTSSSPLATSSSADDYYHNHHHRGGEHALSLSLSTATPPAPKCWRSAMHGLLMDQDNAIGSRGKSSSNHHHQQQDAMAICQNLPDSHLKLLALEIARCHMADLGRDLFSTPTHHADQETAAGEAASSAGPQTSNGGGTDAKSHHDVEPSNCHEPLTNVDDMYLCLKYLTDSGTNAYTQYVSYVQLLCTRLTQEVFLTHQQDVQQEMARRYQDVASQSVSQMETIHGLAKLQTDQFQAMATQLPEQMREKLTYEIQERLSASVSEHLDEHLGTRLKVQLVNLSHVMQEQATNQALAMQRAFEQVSVRERQELDQWWQQSARELQEQRDAMKRAWERMDALLLMGQTNTGITMSSDGGRILAGLEFVLTTLTRGYSWVAFLLYFITTLNMIWLFTRPRICHGFRAHLFALVLLEAAAELMLLFLVEHNVLLTELQSVGYVQELRRWTVFLECTTFVLGLFMSLIYGMLKPLWPPPPPPPPPPTGPTTFIEAMATNTRESFPAPIPSGGTAANGFLMGMDHPPPPSHQHHQQQQQHRMLHYNNTNTSARGSYVSNQQPFGPTLQVTPQQPQHNPFEQETSFLYSPIAANSRGREIFGRRGNGAISDYHHNSHHQQQPAYPSFVPLPAHQPEQLHNQHHHQLPQVPYPQPPHPVMYHEYYSPLVPVFHGDVEGTPTPTPRSNRFFHDTTAATTAHGVKAPPRFPPYHHHYRNDNDDTASSTMGNTSSTLRNAAAAAAAPTVISRLGVVHDPSLSHEQRQQRQHAVQQQQQQKQPPSVSLVHDNHNNNNTPRRVNGSARNNIAPVTVTTTTKNGVRRVMPDDNDDEDVFMDALCEIPQESLHPGASAAATSGEFRGAHVTTTTAATTALTMATSLPTRGRDCATHHHHHEDTNTTAARKEGTKGSLLRKRRANGNDDNDKQVEVVDNDPSSSSESSPGHVQKMARTGTLQR